MRPYHCGKIRLLVLLAAGVSGLSAQPSQTAENAEKGHTIFQQMCVLCHSVEPSAGAGQGPNLAGVFGRLAASSPNFGYTKALRDSKLTWTEPNLDRFLANPTETVPGTNMVVAVPNADDRRNLIAFLATLSAHSVTGEKVASSASVSTLSQTAGNDWQQDRPGLQHVVSLEKLPLPFATSSAGNSPHVVDKPSESKLSVPSGFTVKPFAQGLSGPRVIRVAPNGDIFVAETKANRIRVFRASDGTDQPSSNSVFAKGLDRPFGIAFYPVGAEPRWVYVANNNEIVRYAYTTGDLTAQKEPEIIVPKLSRSTGGHSTRDIAFSNDGKRLFISVGSGSNVAEDISKKTSAEVTEWEKQHGRGAAWDSETNRADILVTDPEGKLPLRAFATGVRNGVGLAVDPSDGQLWVSTNERDGLGDNLVPDYITRVKEGGFYGWPWYYLGNHEDPRHAGERPDLKGEAIVPDVLLQAHSASLEMTFYVATSGASCFPAEYQGDIFAALHGSWNRHSRTGYKIVRVRRHNGVATGEYEDFLTGFVVDNESVWGRPVGVAVARDGALLVADDGGDTLWRVSYTAAQHP